jgi:hypothetical protein
MAEPRYIDLRQISDRAIAVITSPVAFYRNMPKTGGFLEPLVFMIIISFVSGFLFALGFFLGMNPVAGVFFAVGGVVMIPIVVTLGSFLWSLVLFVIWRIAGSREPFEVAYRSFAYTWAISPITTVMALAPRIGFIGGITSFFWTLYLLIVASIEVHRIPPRTAYTVFIALALVLLGVASLAASERHGVLHSFAQQVLNAQRVMRTTQPFGPGAPKAH